MFVVHEQKDVQEENVPIDYAKIHTAQQQDDVELKEVQNNPSRKEFLRNKHVIV